MKITQIATAPNGVLQSINQQWELLTPTGEPPRRSFQQIFYLRFATGGDADGIHIDAQKTTFQVTFKPLSYNAKAHPNPALAAKITSGGQNTLLVELDAPRQISHVELANKLTLGSKAVLEFYRLDGDTVTDKPTTSAAFANSDHFLLLDGAAGSAVSHALTRAAAPQSRAPRAATISQQATARTTRFASTTAIVAGDFTDARFALRLKDPPPTQASLAANDIASISLTSYPAAPRIGLADPNDLAAAIFFKRLDGEIGKAPQPAPGTLDAQENQEFSTALQRHLDNLWAALVENTAEGSVPTLPPMVEVALVIASDAPCSVQISDFALEYALVRQSFPSSQEKVILKFAGDAVQTHVLPVRLPESAVVTKATLQLVPSFGGDRLVDAGAQSSLSAAALAQAVGVHVGLDQWVAQPLTPAQATTLSGLALGLMALVGETKLLLALHEDFHGQPSGKQLVELTIDLEASGQRLWKTLRFAESLIVPSQPHWLLLKAVRGSAIWLAAAADTAVSLMDAPKAGSIGRTLSVLPNLQGLYGFLSTTAPSDPAQKTSPLTVAVGTQSVMPTSEAEEDKVTYDLTGAMHAHAATLTGAEPVNGKIEIPLAVTCGLPGIATVYPPRLLYDRGT